jgi:hypothetical protein
VTKTAKSAPKKGNASQDKKKENKYQINSSLGSLDDKLSYKESSIAVISKATKLVRGVKDLQTCFDEALKTFKPKKRREMKENTIQSCSKSSDDEVNLKNLDKSAASTSKSTKNVNSSPRKGKRRVDSTSPLRRSPRKSVQLQQKVIFLCTCTYIFLTSMYISNSLSKLKGA